MWCPQTFVANLLFERVDDPAPLVAQREELAASEEDLQRFHLVTDEAADPLELLLELRLG
jgi:hypothetical protein